MPEARRPERLLLMAIAGTVLVLGVVLGLVYLRLWTRASEDLTRLLPATTRAWASSPPPWLGVTRALSLDRWSAPTEIEDGLLRTGYFASGRTGEVAGLPVDLAREILRGMDAVEVAVVPTAEGVTAMVFVEIRDLVLRKRVIARLQPLTEAVGRHVGFRIDAIHQSPWQRFTGIDPEPPRVVVMDPWIVFAWGAEQGLDELLDARVGGRSDAIRKRQGFLERGDRQEVRAVIDATSLWLLAYAAAAPDAQAPPIPDDGLMEFLGLLTFVGRIDAHDDLAEVYAEVADRELAARLRAATAQRRHELALAAPSDALLALSLTTEDTTRLAAMLDELGRRLGRDFLPDFMPGPFAAHLLAAFGDLPGGAPGSGASAAELAFIVLPGEASPASVDASGTLDWVLFLRPQRGDLPSLEAALAKAVPARFGADYAHGTAHVDDTVLHAEVALDARKPSLVWRVRGDLVELAPSRAVLERVAIAQASQRTLGQSDRVAEARRGLPTTSGIELLVDLRLLERLDAPMLGLVERRLRPEFMVALTLSMEGDSLVARSNLGVWTLATAIASAGRDEIESFALPGLDPACRAAHFAMCRAYPDAVPCRPFSIGRRARILAACDALRRGGGIEPE